MRKRTILTEQDIEAKFLKVDRAFDGVLCLGAEDWWYHNHGHYDIQMMRHLNSSYRILYINSIGMRLPGLRERRVFVQRIKRKIRSILHGFKQVLPNFFVFSPISLPGFSQKAIGSALLGAQICYALWRAGIHRPLLWLAIPSALPALRNLRVSFMVYQRTDSYEHFPNVDFKKIRSLDLMAKRRAQLTVFCSTFLYMMEQTQCKKAIYVDHGVDLDLFSKACRRDDEPPDLGRIPHPRIGFIGGIDEHTFDAELFVSCAQDNPDCSFVLVGNSSFPEGWCTLSNVYFLGQKEYCDVPYYMAGCDVLIMPWKSNEWIRACNPVKLKEYLAVGKPVVSTYFVEIEKYAHFVKIAVTQEGFTKSIRQCLSEKVSKERLQLVVRKHTWKEKANTILREIEASIL
jgi:glycosyltransferase involved in cell wall biosynthesis